MRYAIEAITMPVTHVDLAKAFYEKAGWNLDADTRPAPGIRVVQFTPPGSDCSISFGTGMPQSEPGSYVTTYLVVADIEPAHRELRDRGIKISDIFHFGPEGQTPGPDPNRGDFGSFANFADPDGNTWFAPRGAKSRFS
jgi:predicted enzyme related to lactoylglutathione lyase